MSAKYGYGIEHAANRLPEPMIRRAEDYLTRIENMFGNSESETSDSTKQHRRILELADEIKAVAKAELSDEELQDALAQIKEDIM